MSKPVPRAAQRGRPGRSARAAVLGMVAAAGCTVGPAYERPALTVPGVFPHAAPAERADAGIDPTDTAWWKVFRDPQLQDLLRRAQRGNPDLLQAAARFERVEAQYAASRAQYAPHLGANLNETVQRISPIGLPQDRTGADPAGSATILQAQAGWEIDFWGKYRRAKEAARALLIAGSAARQAIASSVLGAVACGYFRLLSLDDQHHAAEADAARWRSVVRLTQARVQGGIDSNVELDLARRHAAAAQQSLFRLEDQVTEQENMLRELVGENPGNVQRGLKLAEETLPDVAPGLPSRLLERRPDIRAAEERLIAANANIGIAKAAYFPNIGLTAGGGRESTALHALFSESAATWLLRPSLNLPIFSGGRLRAAVKEAEAHRTLRLQEYIETVHRAFREVSDALSRRQRAIAEESEQEAIARAAADTAALAGQRVSAGADGDLARLRADDEALQGEYDLATARYLRLEATVRLYGALGGGWDL